MALLGDAVSDFFFLDGHDTLLVECDRAPNYEMDVAQFFTRFASFPAVEKVGVEACTGRVLDGGAGAGRHSLYLQAKGHAVTALEPDAKMAKICGLLGVSHVVNQGWHAFSEPNQYDTLLALWNGVGLCQDFANLPAYFGWALAQLKPGGYALFDSTTVDFLPPAKEKSRRIDEVWLRFLYRGQVGEWFSWLFADYDTVATALAASGFTDIDCIYSDTHDQFLIRGYKPL
jgi:SAM-dependent methyltransferase